MHKSAAKSQLQLWLFRLQPRKRSSATAIRTLPADYVEPIPPDSVRVVSIAAGAAMLVHVDVRPTAPIADA